MLRRLYRQTCDAVIFVGTPLGAWWLANILVQLLLQLIEIVQGR